MTTHPGKLERYTHLIRRHWQRWFIPVGLLLVILGGKFILIQSHGSDVPHWDQWDVEGELLIKPWVEGDLSFGSLFAPHNEHRPFFTRAWALGLFILNGQWDARLEAVANAFLHAAGALILLHLLGPLFRGWQKSAFLLLLVLLFALPFNWENTVRGFQSQFYFLLLFSLAQFHGSLTRRPLSPAWWGGQAAGFAALFCMGSGAVSSVAVLIVLGYKAVALRQRDRADLITAGVSLLILFCGFLLRIPAPWHDRLRPDSILAGLHSYSALLAWPFPFFPAAIIMVAPLLFVMIGAARRAEEAPQVLFLTGLGIWAWIQAAGLTYARGGVSLGYASRYSDLLAIGVITSATALAVLLNNSPQGIRRRQKTAILALAWSVLVVSGVVYHSFWGDRQHQRELLRSHPAQIENLRRFIATGDPENLRDKPMLRIPYPDADRLAAFLTDPTIRSILPVSIHPPIPLVTDTFSTHGFIPNGVPPETHAKPLEPSQGSFTDKGIRQEGYYRSQPIDPKLPMLRMTIAGTFPLDQENMTLIGMDSAEMVDPLISKTPGVRFMNLNTFRPDGPFVVSVTDNNPDTWIAISNPVEMGFFTWMAMKLAKLGPEFAVIGGLLISGVLSLEVVRFRRNHRIRQTVGQS
ncbi:MAG: hypothetical protein R3F07_07580 [Opitutaceae bacterium]